MAKIVNFIGDPTYSHRRKQVFIAVLIATVSADILVSLLIRESLMVDAHHKAFLWEEIPGWTAVLGFCFCLLIIMLAKILGRYCGLKKREDYYQKKLLSRKNSYQEKNHSKDN